MARRYSTPVQALSKTLSFSALVVLCGLASGASPVELVMKENTILTATTLSSKIVIRAGRNFERSYDWNGCSLKANMRQRDSRWLGSLGIYDSAGSFGVLSTILPWWFKCNGVSRTVVQEGQLHFVDSKEAEAWLERYVQIAQTVWSDDGLVIQWDLVRGREQINVDVWQLCIDGKRPVGLKGAHDEAIEIRSNELSAAARFECAKVSPEVSRETLRLWKEDL